MKRNTLIILLLLLAAAAGLHYWSTSREEAEEQTKAQETLIVREGGKDDITLVELSGQSYEKPVRIERRAPGEWWITQPLEAKADRLVVERIISNIFETKFQERFKPKGEMRDFGLEPPRGDIRLTAQDGRAVELLVGQISPALGSLYGRLPQSDEVMILPGYLEANLLRGMVDLRDKSALYLQVAEVTKVEIKTPAETVELLRQGDRSHPTWVLGDQSPTDRRVVDDMLFGVISLQTGGFVDDPQDLKAYGLDNPQTALALTLENGSVVGLHIGGRNEESGERYVRGFSGGPVMNVGESSLETVLPSRHALLQRNILDFDSDSVAGLSVRKGGKHLSFASKDGKWEMTAPRQAGADDIIQPDQFLRMLVNLKWEVPQMAPGAWSMETPQAEVEMKVYTLPTAQESTGTKVYTLLFGKPAEEGGLLPVRLDGREQVFGVEADLLTLLDNWLDQYSQTESKP